MFNMGIAKSTISIIGVLIATSFVESVILSSGIVVFQADAQTHAPTQDELYLRLKNAKSQDKEITDRAQVEISGSVRTQQLQSLSEQNKKNNQAADQEYSKLPEEPEGPDGPEPSTGSSSLSPRGATLPPPRRVESSADSPKVSQDPLPPTLVFPGGSP